MGQQNDRDHGLNDYHVNTYSDFTLALYVHALKLRTSGFSNGADAAQMNKFQVNNRVYINNLKNSSLDYHTERVNFSVSSEVLTEAL